uniref:Uncharacterized protein n=1 Tax=Glossina palpalis gambiensis TaxID=67801 RepID=A0A1B0BIF5_9MUSC
MGQTYDSGDNYFIHYHNLRIESVNNYSASFSYAFNSFVVVVVVVVGNMVGRYRMKEKRTCMFDDVLTHSHHRCIPFVTYQDTRIVDSTISQNSEFAYHSVDEHIRHQVVDNKSPRLAFNHWTNSSSSPFTLWGYGSTSTSVTKPSKKKRRNRSKQCPHIMSTELQLLDSKHFTSSSINRY